jgi:hypothetical protein
MRKHIFAAALAVLTVLVPAALAGSPDFTSLRVSMEQSFRVGQTTLPAGAYSIRVLTIANVQPSLEFTGENGHSILVPAMHFEGKDEEVSKTTRLVLSREDGSLVLERIWVGGTTGGFEIIGAR